MLFVSFCLSIPIPHPHTPLAISEEGLASFVSVTVNGVMNYALYWFDRFSRVTSGLLDALFSKGFCVC